MSTDIHTRAGKRKFIRDLCNNIRDGVLGRVADMPNEWDGHELREYLAEQFRNSAYMEMDRSRYADYRNVVATTENL